MNRRHDALATAARELLAVRDTVRAEEGRQVGTVGYMKAEPGAPNVIAGRVEFPYELRDLDAAKIEHMRERTQQRFADIDREEGTTTVCTEVNHIEPALSDPGIQATIRAAARSAVARPIPEVPPKITIRSDSNLVFTDSNCVFSMRVPLVVFACSSARRHRERTPHAAPPSGSAGSCRLEASWLARRTSPA